MSDIDDELRRFESLEHELLLLIQGEHPRSATQTAHERDNAREQIVRMRHELNALPTPKRL